MIPGRHGSEEELRDDYTIHQKVHYHSHWKRNQDAVYRVKLSRARDQGLQFWQTKSYAIIVHSPVSPDCIYRVISQNGDRILFERLSISTTCAISHTQKQLAIAAAAIGLRGRDLHKETCATTGRGQGMSEATQQMIKLAQGATIRNLSLSRRSISRCYLAR